MSRFESPLDVGLPSRSAAALLNCLQKSIPPEPRFDFFHDARDGLVARAAAETFLNRCLERFEPGVPLLVAATRVAVVRQLASAPLLVPARPTTCPPW